jgi:hypothetical protein
MAAIVMWRLRRPGRPASANRTAAWPPVLDPTAARGWAAMRSVATLGRIRRGGARHWRDFERGDPAIAQNAAAHARERLDEQARKIRCRIDSSNLAPRSFSSIVYGEQLPFSRLALPAGRPGAGHLHAISAQALAALTDSSAAPRVRHSRSLAGLARASFPERRTEIGHPVRQDMNGFIHIHAPATRPVPIPIREIFPWAAFAGVLALLLIYFIGAEQGATALISGHYVHEYVHDGRHLLAFPCH